jgi:hypothetical protein
MINKETNQECYLIFCFVETYILAWSYTYLCLLYTVVLLVANRLKNLLLIN